MIDLFNQPAWATSVGAWLGFAVVLLIFSGIFGDRWLARLGQYILLGAAIGYAAAITWRTLLELPLVQGLRDQPLARPWDWIPVLLAVLLLVAALERIFFQGEGGPPPAGFRRVLRWLGALPAAFLLAAGVAVAATGAVQGTLLPQFLQAARTGITWNAPLDVFLTGVITLVVTAAALVYFGLDPQRHLADQPALVQQIMRGWVWFGQRAVWLAAGVLFARLAVSRISLLIAQFEYLRIVFISSGAWQALETWWRARGGG